MTLKRIETLLKKIDPNFNIRQRGDSDVAGVFYKNQYILRLNRGELPLNSYRTHEGLKRRGRYQMVRLLIRYGWIKPKHRKMLVWGLGV